MKLRYQYRARTSGGTIIKGASDFSSQQQAVQWIRNQGNIPISVEIDMGGGQCLSRQIDKMRSITTVSLKDKAVFFRQLATMISSGVTLASSLNTISRQTRNRRLALTIEHVKKLVDKGFSFSSAMSTRKEFSALMVSMVKAGEEGGVLDITLERLASFLERQDALRRKITSALSYPCVVLIFTLVALYLLITVIVPKFALAFSHLNAAMPRITTIIFDSALWLKDKWYITLMVLIILIAAVVVLNHLKSTRPFMDRVKLKIPVVGDLVYKAMMARTLRTLATLIEAGVPILTSLSMTASVSGNHVADRAYQLLKTEARRGHSLGVTAQHIGLFPAMVAHMITIGEETGRMEQMLDKVADWFEMELDEKVKRLTSVLEPLLIVFVGGVVALVVFAVFMPIIGAIQALI